MTQQSGGTQPEQVFDAYTAALETGEAPLLGHLVLYSIFDGRVTRDDLQRWFDELGLDAAFVPPPLRAVDAFEKVTGPDGMSVSYPLDEPARPPRSRRRRTGDGRQATLMVRHVRRDAEQIVRHLVREVCDEAETRLSYDTRLGECIFRRDNTSSEAGAGQLHVAPDQTAIRRLPEEEQQRVTTLLFDIHAGYQHRCRFLTGDKLRSVIRSYVEALNAIKVRPTGGVYFVHRQHAPVLVLLRELVARFGQSSHLVRIPLPDQDEMRQMVIAAFTTKSQDDLNRLARDIAAAGGDGHTRDATVAALYQRFQQVQAATTEHSQLLSTTLDDTHAALRLVKIQLGSLLATNTDD